MARLLVCRSCGVAMKMRDFHGIPSDDQELRVTIDAHLGKAVDPRPESHPAQLFVVADEDLELMNEETLNEALKNQLDVEISELRDDFKDQAMQCYNLHGRPTGGCGDWCTESRVIGRKTGIAPADRAYLCSYCPVSVWMEKRARTKAGLYKK